MKSVFLSVEQKKTLITVPIDPAQTLIHKKTKMNRPNDTTNIPPMENVPDPPAFTLTKPPDLPQWGPPWEEMNNEQKIIRGVGHINYKTYITETRALYEQFSRNVINKGQNNVRIRQVEDRFDAYTATEHDIKARNKIAISTFLGFTVDQFPGEHSEHMENDPAMAALTGQPDGTIEILGHIGTFAAVMDQYRTDFKAHLAELKKDKSETVNGMDLHFDFKRIFAYEDAISQAILDTHPDNFSYAFDEWFEEQQEQE